MSSAYREPDVIPAPEPAKRRDSKLSTTERIMLHAMRHNGRYYGTIEADGLKYLVKVHLVALCETWLGKRFFAITPLGKQVCDYPSLHEDMF